MRIVTFNTLFGGENRFPRILQLLARAAPDVLVLQECLGWEDGVRLKQVASATGLTHAHLGQARPRGSGKRYHVALLSRLPMQNVRDHNDPTQLGHCVVEAVIDGITFYGTHFDSHGEDQRVREATYVNGLLKPGRSVLAGDLNALCRRDPYPKDLAEQLQRAGVDKYGHPPRFDCIATLERAGWHDGRDGDDWITARRDRGGVHIDYRTDYVFVCGLMPREHRILPADGASDHDAVIVTV